MPMTGKSHVPKETVRATVGDSVPDWLINNIAEAIKSTQQVFFILISFLVYSAITIVATGDRQIVLNSTVQLPLLGSTVSLEGFLLLVPAVAVLIFCYFHLYLLRLRGLVMRVHKEYGDLERGRLYPWVLTIAEDPETGTVGTIERAATHFCLWWILPLVLILFPLSSIKEHSLMLTSIVGLYPLITAVIVIFFWKHYQVPSGQIRLNRAIRLLIAFIVFASLLIIGYLSPKAYWGRFGPPDVELTTNASVSTFFPAALRRLITVDLSYQVLVTEQKNEYDTFWVDLEGARLEGANLKHAILKLANLRNAHLQGANCLNTTFRTAMLEGADFRDAYLQGADLSYAKLMGAKNLRVDQICKARTLYNAKADAGLLNEVRSTCPKVLTAESQNW